MKTIIIDHNGSKFAGQQADPVEDLYHRLAVNKLDPERNWTWTRGAWRHFGGNFEDVSAAFQVAAKIGSSAEKKLSAAFRRQRRNY